MSRKRIIITVIIAVIFVIGSILLWSLWNRAKQGTLEISAPAETPNSSVVVVEILQPDKEKQTLELQPGQTKQIQLMPGNVQVNGTAGDSKSIDVVTIERQKTTKLTTPNGQQRNIELLGLNARFCPVVLPEKLFSYNCQADGPIIKHAATTSATIFGGRLFSLLQPTPSGLIGFYAENLVDLQFLNLQNETIQPITLPSNIQPLVGAETATIVTSSEPNDERFALFFPLGNKIYLFDNISDTEPVEIVIGASVSPSEEGRTISISLIEGGVIVYAGSDSHTHDGEAERVAEEPHLHSYLFEYNNSGEPTGTIDLGEGFDAEAMYKIANNYYLGEKRGGFEFYYLEQGKLQAIYTLSNVTSWVGLSGKSYIVSNRSIYLFNPAEGGTFGLSSIFTSPELPVSEIFSSSSGVVFTGYAGDSTTSPLNIYRLLDSLAQPGTPLPGVPLSTEIEFTNFGSLLEFGVTSEQLGALRNAFSAFILTQPESVKQVVIESAAATPRDRFSASTTQSVIFDVLVGGTRYKATMEYSNLTTIRLYLYDRNGTLVYDSQNIST